MDFGAWGKIFYIKRNVENWREVELDLIFCCFLLMKGGVH